jgi:hypothetical protein
VFPAVRAVPGIYRVSFCVHQKMRHLCRIAPKRLLAAYSSAADPGLLTWCGPPRGLNVADLRAYWNRLRPVGGKRVRIDAR